MLPFHAYCSVTLLVCSKDIRSTWAYLVGIAANLKVKAIRVLNNGRRAISLVKHGLNFIADTLFNPFRPTKINVFDFLSCT